MRNCIVRDGFISGIWTCQTDEDFEFKNNIVSGCDYFWIRKAGDTQKYTIENCIVIDNKFYSGYGVESGATGQTGDDISFTEEDVIKEGQLLFGDNPKNRNYLHILEYKPENKLNAGLFKK